MRAKVLAKLVAGIGASALANYAAARGLEFAAEVVYPLPQLGEFASFLPGVLLVLPIALLTSSAVGGAMGAGTGLKARWVTIAALLGWIAYWELENRYYANSLLDWFTYHAYEDALTWGHASAVIGWGAAGTCAGCGLVAGIAIGRWARPRVLRCAVAIAGCFAAGLLLLGLLYYPVVWSEMASTEDLFETITDVRSALTRSRAEVEKLREENAALRRQVPSSASRTLR